MTEFLIDSGNELKRAEHILYVSLKYTRTVDVIRMLIQRVINAYDFLINGILDKLKEEEKIEEIPTAPGSKVETVKKFYPDNEQLIEYLEFYAYLRKLLRAKFTRSTEFRRHVTMTSTIIDPESETETIVDVKIETCKNLIGENIND